MTHDTPGTFAIVPVPNPSRAPAQAIVVGPMSEVMEYIPQSVARADAIEQLERARLTADEIKGIQEKTRAVQVAMLADSLSHLSSRMDALVAQRAERARLDAEREEEEEQQRIQDELAALPDPDEPDIDFLDPPHPTGDLHSIPARCST